MRLLYPLCFLALLLIPIVILFYILKSKYTEQTVNSTYIWTLSEKFLKRRNPFSGLTGLIALLLQLLMIILVTVALVHPTFILKNRANEYCFILDASESMNMEKDGVTRFEVAKNEIEEIIDSSKKGSKYTLIYAGNEAVTVFQGMSEKKNAIKRLDELEPAYVGSNMTDAIQLAQGYFNENPGILTYLVTDKNYGVTQNIELVNVSRGEDNYGVKDIDCEVVIEADASVSLNVSAVLNAYKMPTSLNVSLYIDDNKNPSSQLNCMVGTGDDYDISFPPVKLATPTYSKVRVVIENKDALDDDSEIIFYNVKNKQQYKTIIVSETPFFFEASIISIDAYDVITVTPEEYEAHEKEYVDSGFGLYIFDSYTPEKLPDNGAVWMINSQRSLENTGFTYRSDVDFSGAARLEKSTSSNTIIRKLLDGIVTKDIYTAKCARYSVYGEYTTLFSCDGMPMIMVGENSYGNRMTVFSFSLHDSNIALTGDFVNLIGNLLEYSFPSVIDETVFTAGDEVIINTVANCDEVKVTSPSGEIKYLETDRTMNTISLSEIGTYTVHVTVGGSEREHNFFSQVQPSEREVQTVDPMASIVGEPSEEKLPSELDPSIVIFILIILVFAADWMVYMYEKRQLR